ncbi:MFS transporter [Spirillospora sp. CA-255316]
MAERQTGRHRRPPESQATYREVFAVGEFRALWLAQALSFVGDQLAQVALAVLVYERTNSALLTALTYALTYIPPIVGGPVLSGLADLFPRRRVMVICDVLRAGLVALMALQAMPFWMLCVLVFLTVLLGAPFSAARAAVLPDVLPGDRYVAGSAITNITHQGTQMLGFLAGGAVVAVVGTREALALDSVTFALSAVILVAGLRRRPAPKKRRGRQSLGLWQSTWDGGRLVFGDPTLRSLVSFAWLCGFYVVPEGLAAPYAATFDGGAVTVGLLMSAMPTGMVIGAFVFSRFVRPSDRIRSMGWMSILACAPLVGAAAHPPLWLVVVLWALSGVGSAYQLAANAAFVAAVPPSGRGQAFGLAQSGILAGQGLGILVAGAAAQVLGPETVVAFAGALGLSLAAVLTVSWNQVRGQVIASMYERGAGAGAGPAASGPGGSDPGRGPGPGPGSGPGTPPDAPEVHPEVEAGVERVSTIVAAGRGPGEPTNGSAPADGSGRVPEPDFAPGPETAPGPEAAPGTEDGPVPEAALGSEYARGPYPGDGADGGGRAGAGRTNGAGAAGDAGTSAFSGTNGAGGIGGAEATGAVGNGDAQPAPSVDGEGTVSPEADPALQEADPAAEVPHQTRGGGRARRGRHGGHEGAPPTDGDERPPRDAWRSAPAP